MLNCLLSCCYPYLLDPDSNFRTPGSLAKLGRNRNPTVAAVFSCGGLAAENSFRCEEARRQELAAPIGEEEKASLTP